HWEKVRMRDSQSAGRLKLGSPLEQIAIEPEFPISRINLRKSANKKPCFVSAPARPRAGVYLSLAHVASPFANASICSRDWPWPPASFPTCCPPVGEFCRRLQPPACPLCAMPGRHTSESVVSSLARKCRKVSHARQLERVHHLDDRSKRRFPIRLQGQRRLLRLGKVA